MHTGVGYKMGNELDHMGVKTASDLRQVPRDTLTQKFGERIGTFLQLACRGQVSASKYPPFVHAPACLAACRVAIARPSHLHAAIPHHWYTHSHMIPMIMLGTAIACQEPGRHFSACLPVWHDLAYALKHHPSSFISKTFVHGDDTGAHISITTFTLHGTIVACKAVVCFLAPHHQQARGSRSCGSGLISSHFWFVM